MDDDGRDYGEQRFSPLEQITRTTSTSSASPGTPILPNRGQEATPLVIDGVIYVLGVEQRARVRRGTGGSSGATTPRCRASGPCVCCDVVNRGVAAWNGKIYVGTLDGRWSRSTRRPAEVWDVVTIVRSERYSITGALRVVKGLVLIGNGGAEFGVRGYVSAYDAETGEQRGVLHRAGQSGRGFENEAMALAARPGTASGGSSAAAARSGTRSSTTPSRTSSISARVTAAPGTRRSAAPAAATTCSFVDRRARSRRRPYRLALPDDAGRDLGLHGDAADHGRGPHFNGVRGAW